MRRLGRPRLCRALRRPCSLRQGQEAAGYEGSICKVQTSVGQPWTQACLGQRTAAAYRQGSSCTRCSPVRHHQCGTCRWGRASRPVRWRRGESWQGWPTCQRGCTNGGQARSCDGHAMQHSSLLPIHIMTAKPRCNTNWCIRRLTRHHTWWHPCSEPSQRGSRQVPQ